MSEPWKIYTLIRSDSLKTLKVIVNVYLESTKVRNNGDEKEFFKVCNKLPTKKFSRIIKFLFVTT